jgi:hypothetical protein
MRIALALLVLAGTAAADVPADVAAYGPSGVQLGAKPLFQGPVDIAVYDGDKDLVWFLSKGMLQVIDLRDGSKITIIAKGVSDPQFAIDGMSRAQVDAIYTSSYASFHFDAKPRVEVGQGVYTGVFPDADKAKAKAIKKIEIVGAKWIVGQQKRPANKAKPMRSSPPDIKLPDGVGQCENASLCGTARWVGDSPYEAVVIQHGCGDACHADCALYDPKKKKFAKAGAWGDAPEAGPCDYVATTDRYLAGDRVCSLASLSCTPLGGDWIAFAFVAPTGG